MSIIDTHAIWRPISPGLKSDYSAWEAFKLEMRDQLVSDVEKNGWRIVGPLTLTVVRPMIPMHYEDENGVEHEVPPFDALVIDVRVEKS